MGPPGRSGKFHVTPVTGPVRAGRAELSTWVRGVDATVRVAIAWFGASGRPVGLEWTSVPAVDRWRRARVVSRPPQRAAYAQVVVEARRLTGSVWLDDVSFSWR
jgi:hypothetical protein